MRRLLALAVLVGGLLGGTSAPPAVAAGAAPGWRTVAVGANHSCGVRTDRTLWCWGENEDGQLGTGGTDDATVPVRIGAERTWDTVRVGLAHSCAIEKHGTLWCWGNESHWALGVAGAGHRPAPTRVGTGTEWKELAAGRYLTCAVRRDRTLWCWGTSRTGALGQGAGVTVAADVTRVGTDHDWTAVTAGRDHVCGTRTDRSLWCWGSGASGQLGVGDLGNRSEPARIDSTVSWTAPSAGQFHTCSVGSRAGYRERILWCWGRDRRGELGLGEPSPRLQRSPARLYGARTYLRVGAGGSQTCAARANETLWCWGAKGRAGVAGIGDVDHRVAVRVPGATGDWMKISSGEASSCAIDAARRMWCWGGNGSGQLGLGDRTDRTTPAPVA